MMCSYSNTTRFFCVVFVLFLLYITTRVLSGSEPYYLSSVNLIFHESGHFIFAIFGETLQFLGGTFGQLLVPLIFVVYFFIHRNFYAMLVLLWWFGENMIGISIYIKDAHTQDLPLIGGIHDWMFLLSKWGIMGYDQEIGGAVFFLGVFIMSISLILAIAFVVYPFFLNRK